MVDNIFLQLFLILITARIFGELFTLISLPSVLGELFAGVFLGVSILGLIEPNETIKILAELGILLLLFDIGMETDVARLKKSGTSAFIVALFGALVPFAFGYLLSREVFGLDLMSALFVGGTLTATSIGITLRVLKDINKQGTIVAQVVLGAAVIDDIIGVLLLVFVYDLSVTGEVSFANTLKVFAITTMFFFIAPPTAYMLSKIIYYLGPRAKVAGFMPTIIVSLILVFGYLSHLMGVPEILGSFAAGLALSRRFFLPLGVALREIEHHYFIDYVEKNMRPIIYLFTPIFFVTVGLSLNINVIDFSSLIFWQISLALLVVAVVGKFSGAYLVSGFSARQRLQTGVSMVARGEVGLIFAELGRSQGILDEKVYAILIFVIIVTTIIPPLLLKRMFEADDE